MILDVLSSFYLGNPEQVSEVTVYVQVLDVNDHAPEFPKHYEIYVCENARSGQVRGWKVVV